MHCIKVCAAGCCLFSDSVLVVVSVVVVIVKKPKEKKKTEVLGRTARRPSYRSPGSHTSKENKQIDPPSIVGILNWGAC